MNAYQNAQDFYDNMEAPQYEGDIAMGDSKCVGCGAWIIDGVDISVTIDSEEYCMECAESWNPEDWR